MRAVLRDHPGPGVDLRGTDAARVMAAAAPMIAWLDAREPGVEVRSISVNEARVLVSVAGIATPDSPAPKPRALRIDADDLREAGRPAEAITLELACAAVARRVTSG